MLDSQKGSIDQTQEEDTALEMSVCVCVCVCVCVYVYLSSRYINNSMF